MRDHDLEQEVKDRLAARYTAAELADLLDISVEDFIETYWEYILEHGRDGLEEVGALSDD